MKPSKSTEDFNECCIVFFFLIVFHIRLIRNQCSCLICSSYIVVTVFVICQQTAREDELLFTQNLTESAAESRQESETEAESVDLDVRSDNSGNTTVSLNRLSYFS